MLLRVSCDYPCFVRADGLPCGKVDGEPKYLSADGVLEFLPLAGANALPVCVDLATPMQTGVTVTDYGAVKDYFVRVPRLPPSRTEVLFQESVHTPRGKLLTTAVRDGNEKITIDGQGLFGVFDLPYGLSGFRAEYGEIAKTPCLTVFGSRQRANYAFVYDLSRSCLLFQGEANEVCYGHTLKTTRRAHNLARHTITAEWAYADGGLTAQNVNAVRSKSFDFLSLLPFAKPYALAEELLVGGNATDFLTEDLKDRADDLKNYLGGFTAVLPPPSVCKTQSAALLYPVCGGYKAKFLTAKFCGGQIDNLSLSPESF